MYHSNMKLESVVVMLVFVVISIWCSVAVAELAPINPDNLDPGAAHVCQVTDREAYTQRVAFKQYYTQKTNTWCFSVPPRCTEYRIASRTSYKIETHYRDRKRYFCCSGYKSLEGHSYCVPVCEHDCYQDKYHGYCVTPGKCNCHPGYKGTYCESGCDSQHWGQDCSKTCNCGNYGSCDPANGNCICHIGYTGQNCSQKCQESFGLHCIHPCVCENDAICDNVNGKCTCKKGFYGAYCHKTCDQTTSGEQGCEQECPCQNGGVCDEVTKACICPAGVKGEYCTVFCDKFHWGVNCTNTCSCDFGKCNPKDGVCTCDHGYAGVSCQIKCPDGFYGAGCLTPCGCKNGGKCNRNEATQMIECNCAYTGFHGDTCSVRDCPDGQYLVSGSAQNCQNCSCEWSNSESCHPLSGTCSCKPGYKGNQCKEKCTMPFYGKDCTEVCQCANGDCDHVTGECTTCYPGYLGVECDEPCPEGTWGLNCVNNCTCLNGAKCHVKSGYCQCKPGYAGLTCEKFCEKDKFGPGCLEHCNCNHERSTCSPLNGQCLCKPGYTGERCEQTCSEGKYGYFCMSDCDCTRQGTEKCDPKTGYCHCKGGWSGKKCDTLCGNNNWGPNCVNTCNCNGNGNCHSDIGVCLCFDGFRGDRCELDDNGVVVVAQQKGNTDSSASSSMVPLIIGIVIPCIILLVILALVVSYYMRKVRRLKEENLQVQYRHNGTLPGQTIIPNGNAQTGVVNPTYEEDNLRNDLRYPHLSQRLSQARPPLPHRQQACDPCNDIDVEKLRVQMDSATNRPVSSQYADIDDVEDRYTTLKSVAGDRGTLTTEGSESGGFVTSPGDEKLDSAEESHNAETSGGGFINKTYADTTATPTPAKQSIGAFSRPLYDNKEPSANGTSLDQPDASADSDQNPAKCLEQQASREYDFPKSTRLSSIQTPDLDFIVSEGYFNSNLHLSLEKDTKSKRENPYDTPKKSISENLSIDQNGYLTPKTVNGYLTPMNDVNSAETSA